MNWEEAPVNREYSYLGVEWRPYKYPTRLPSPHDLRIAPFVNNSICLPQCAPIYRPNIVDITFALETLCQIDSG